MSNLYKLRVLTSLTGECVATVQPCWLCGGQSSGARCATERGAERGAAERGRREEGGEERWGGGEAELLHIQHTPNKEICFRQV